MCIIPFWLVDWETAGWLHWEAAGWPWEGWLAPGKADTAGCARRLLAEVCWFAEFADFRCCCLVVEAQGWCWFFGCPRDLTGNSGPPLWMFKNRPVTQSMASKQEEANMTTNVQMILVDLNANSWIFIINTGVSMYFPCWVCIVLTFDKPLGLFLSVFGTFPRLLL